MTWEWGPGLLSWPSRKLTVNGWKVQSIFMAQINDVQTLPIIWKVEYPSNPTLFLPHSFCHGILAVPVYIIRPQDKSRGERLEREGEKKISSIMSCKMKWKLEQTRKSSDTKVIISRQLKRNVMIYMGQIYKGSACHVENYMSMWTCLCQCVRGKWEWDADLAEPSSLYLGVCLPWGISFGGYLPWERCPWSVDLAAGPHLVVQSQAVTTSPDFEFRVEWRIWNADNDHDRRDNNLILQHLTSQYKQTEESHTDVLCIN